MRCPALSLALSVVAVLFSLIAITAGPSFAQIAAAGPIPPGSRVVIAPMGGFETYFAAAVREKKVPITLTLDKESAQYFIVSTDTEWQGFVYGAGGSANWSQSGGSASYGAAASSTRGLEASIMLIDANTKDVVWAYEVHKSSHGGLLLGTMAARGKQSVAEACAKHLKEFIEKNVGGRETGSSSVIITPVVQHSADRTSNSPENSNPTPTHSSQSSQSTPMLSAVSVNSTPAGADVFVDDGFVGNTPSTLNISAGKHVVAVRKSGFQEWVRSVNLYGGSITLNAELAHSTDEMHAATPALADGSKESVSAEAYSSQTSVGWIGVHAQNSGDVAVVTNVMADSPGAKAGIQVGDVILALDGRLMKGKDFETAVAVLKPGTQISLNYARGSSAHEVSITVGSHNM